MENAARYLRATFLVGLAVLVVLIVTRQLGEIIPDGIAAHVSRNSEGMVALLLLTGWILYVRSRPSGVSPVVTAVVAGGLVLLGVVLLVGDFTSTLRTLNETCFAAAVLTVYIALPRPLPRWAWALPIGAAVAAVATAGTDFGTDLAETYVFLVLLPLALDVFDRSILEPDQPERPGLLAGWLVFIVAAPAFFSVVRPDQPYEGIEYVLRYMSRPTEAFLAVLLLHLFFLLDKVSGRAETPRQAAVGVS